jgi:hypothetical protein
MIIFEPISRNANDVIKKPMITMAGVVLDQAYSTVAPNNLIEITTPGGSPFYYADWRGPIFSKTEQTVSNTFHCCAAKYYITNFNTKYAAHHIK